MNRPQGAGLADPPLARIRAWRRQFLSLVADFVTWIYLGYAAFSLHYLYTSPTLVWRPEEKFVLPSLGLWGWLLVALVAFELALAARSFGWSVGLRSVGCILVGEDGVPPRIGQRLRYFLAAQGSLLPLGIGVCLNARRPWHERWSGVRLVPMGEAITARRPWYRRQFGVMGLVLLGVTVALGWRVTGINLGRMIQDATRPMRMWRGLFNPDFRYFFQPDPGIDQSVVDGLVESLFMALLATVFGALIAFPLSFLGARNLTAKGPLGTLVYGVTRVVFNVFRSVESIFWAAIFAIWVGWGPFAGSVALMIHTIAALGKLYSEQVEHIDPGPLEAVAATGASRLEVVRYAVVPQIIPPFLAFTLYRWDINLRMATVVALVGGGGIGRLFFWYKDDLQWHFVGAVVAGFAAVVWALDYVSGWVREKIT